MLLNTGESRLLTFDGAATAAAVAAHREHETNRRLVRSKMHCVSL
jgi:hypothetical protein